MLSLDSMGTSCHRLGQVLFTLLEKAKGKQTLLVGKWTHLKRMNACTSIRPEGQMGWNITLFRKWFTGDISRCRPLAWEARAPYSICFSSRGGEGWQGLTVGFHMILPKAAFTAPYTWTYNRQNVIIDILPQAQYSHVPLSCIQQP